MDAKLADVELQVYPLICPNRIHRLLSPNQCRIRFQMKAGNLPIASDQRRRIRARASFIFGLILIAGSISIAYLSRWNDEYPRLPFNRRSGTARDMPSIEQSEPASKKVQLDSPQSSSIGGVSHKENSTRHGPTSDQSGRLPSVNWNLVLDSYPIPREMPAKESDSPYEAGFASEWVVRSLRDRTAFFMGNDITPLIDPKPLILDIMSEAKHPEDTWAYGVEYELRRTVDEIFKNGQPPDVTRLFCNIHGCLVYFEYQNRPPASFGSFPGAIRRANWTDDFGISNHNLFGLIGRRDDLGIQWQLFLIHRNPPSAKRLPAFQR